MSNAPFSIGGGKPEDGETNWKYLDSAETLDEALTKFYMWAHDYPVSELKYTAPTGLVVDLTPRLENTNKHSQAMRQSRNRWNPSDDSKPLDAFGYTGKSKRTDKPRIMKCRDMAELLMETPDQVLVVDDPNKPLVSHDQLYVHNIKHDKYGEATMVGLLVCYAPAPQNYKYRFPEEETK